MKIKTLFFGITTDLVGASEMQITVDKNASIKTFKAVLQGKFINLKNINSYAIAVNETYADDHYLLKTGDIVAVIPPVSGG